MQEPKSWIVFSADDLLRSEQSGETGGYVVDGQGYCIKHAAQRYGLHTLADVINSGRAVIVQTGGEAICVLCKARI